MEKEKLSKYRAEVIERFINIETLMNSIICQHYFKKVNKDFYFEVLYDENFSFGLRRNILKKVTKDIDTKKLEELGRLNNIRNNFAHCNQEIFDIKDVEIKDGKVIEKTQGKVIDPRKIKEEIDFEALYTEFNSVAGGVEAYLFKLYTDLGGKSLKG